MLVRVSIKVQSLTVRREDEVRLVDLAGGFHCSNDVRDKIVNGKKSLPTRPGRITAQNRSQ